MKYLVPLVMVVLLSSCGDDDGIALDNRYVESVFTTVVETENVKYGENAGLAGSSRDLFMNIFEPADDPLDMRPAIVLAHGGAFVSGTRFRIRDLCEEYARRGFVAVTIDYRLINDITVDDSIAFSEGVVLTLGDMKAAIRFIRDNAENENTYRIDPSMIFAGGVSAGAVMANHVGFLDETDEIPDYLQNHINTHGGFEGNSNSVTSSSEVSGIISFSGSLFRTDWIQAGDPPVFIVHEELDPIVPCGFDSSDAFPFEIFASGGCSISERADEVGVSSQFILFEGADAHVGYLQDDNADAMIDASAEFLAAIIADQ